MQRLPFVKESNGAMVGAQTFPPLHHLGCELMDRFIYSRSLRLPANLAAL